MTICKIANPARRIPVSRIPQVVSVLYAPLNCDSAKLGDVQVAYRQLDRPDRLRPTKEQFPERVLERSLLGGSDRAWRADHSGTPVIDRICCPASYQAAKQAAPSAGASGVPLQCRQTTGSVT